MEKQLQVTSIEDKLCKSKEKIEKSKSDLAIAHEELKVKKSECDQLKSEISSAQQSAYFKKLKRKEDLFATYETFFKKHIEDQELAISVIKIQNIG
jgi:hypothetical protein